jgi:hypothetical protein
MKIMRKLFLLPLVTIFFSCGGNEGDEISQLEIDSAMAVANYNPIILERNGIKLVEFTDFPPFLDVSTEITTQNQSFKMGINKIEFKTKFLNLGQKTVEEKIHNSRLNEAGQYLGVLEPNGKLSKIIQKGFEVDVNVGDNYYFCYLSRSYNLSLKNSHSSFLFKINADPSGCYSETNLSDTVVALLQPRGSYSSNVQEKILFDFYLKNVKIGSNGNYLLVNIDNSEFKLMKWAPFWIKGLKTGKHTIKIDLKDEEGKSIKNLMPKQLNQTIELEEVVLFDE